MNRSLFFSLFFSFTAACSGASSSFSPVAVDDSADDKADSARLARERKPDQMDPSFIETSAIPLGDALRAAAAAHGPLIEAKFELDDERNLSLSMYPVGRGVDVDAERNVFQELAGDPTVTPFPLDQLSVFSDQEHLTRSSRDLTLVQLSSLSLIDAVDIAAQYGYVYWAVPAIAASGRAGYNVYLLIDGKRRYGFIDGGGSDERGVEILGAGPGSGATDARTPELGDDLSVLRSAKVSMSAALKAAEAKYGKTIEAKFELGDDGKLSLSIYPVKSGATINAEKAVFQELAGDPTATVFAPTLSTFAATDVEHLTRSARDLTLVQTAGLSLRDAVAKAETLVPGGIVYWAIPTRRDTRAGYGVYVYGADGQSHYYFIH